MDTDQLLCLINRKKGSGNYISTLVISENEAVGNISKKPLLLICNTDPAWLPGKHWVGFYFPKNGEAEFFDSFGHSPDFYNQDFESFLMNNSQNGCYFTNTCQLQRNGSNVCGLYCILYVLSKYKNESYKSFVEEFNPLNRQQNDMKCVEKIQSLFDVILNYKM
jgi:hypothetical protein